MSKMMDVYNAVRKTDDTFHYEHDGFITDIDVKRYISPMDKQEIAKQIADICFAEKNGEQIYLSAMVVPLVKLFFVNAHCKDFYINPSEDGDACFDLLENTEFIDKLMSFIGMDEYYSLYDCVTGMIDFRLDNYRARISSSRLDNAITGFLEKINSLLPDDVNSKEYSEFIKKIVNAPDDKNIVKQILEFRGDPDVS